jgi:Fe-S-cluster containining protein
MYIAAMDQGKKLPPPFPSLLASRRVELTALETYPPGDLAAIISAVGFRCDCCGRCCTREFNGYVLLLEEDTLRIRAYEQEALEPVPVFDFCDQHGRYYTSGYTIRSRGYPEGSCHFLKDRRCRIYEQRPAVCRVYPYMLRQEPDEEGNVDWRQISGLDQHGEYHTAISGEDALRIANQTRLFEEAAIAHEIAYLDFTGRYFLEHGLRNVRKKFDDGLRSAERGEEIEVMVFFQGTFEPWILKAGTAVQRSASR